jgi:hypothetical protein
MLVAIAGLGLLTLASGALSVAVSREQGSTVEDGQPPPGPAVAEKGSGARAEVAESDRTPIRVLIERRANPDDDACSPVGRVPISVMIACQRKDRVGSDHP